MKKLGTTNINLIKRAVNQEGTYNPEEIMYIIEENLTFHEYDLIYFFLDFMYKNNLQASSYDQYENRYAEFIESVN